MRFSSIRVYNDFCYQILSVCRWHACRVRIDQSTSWRFLSLSRRLRFAPFYLTTRARTQSLWSALRYDSAASNVTTDFRWRREDRPHDLARVAWQLVLFSRFDWRQDTQKSRKTRPRSVRPKLGRLSSEILNLYSDIRIISDNEAGSNIYFISIGFFLFFIFTERYAVCRG